MLPKLNQTPFQTAIISTLVLQLCSLRIINKYLLPEPAFLIPVLVGAFICYFLIFKYFINTKWRTLLDSKYIFPSILLVVLASNLIVYPEADALKLIGQGTDTDNAVITSCTRLFHGQYPYVKTYLGNNVSTGPGLVILLAPFALPKAYVLMTPFFVFIFYLLVRKIFNDLSITNVLFLLLISVPGFWEYMFIGYDFFAISGLFSICLFALYQYQHKPAAFLFFCFFFGLICTSRIIFIYLIPVLSFAYFKINMQNGIRMFAVALTTCILTHLTFYLWNPGNYQPLHLLTKGQKSVPPFLAGLTITGLLYLGFCLVQTKNISQAKIISFFTLFMIIPLTGVGIGRLITDGFDFKYSEGPGYLLPALFPFLLYIGFQLKSLQNPIPPKP